VRVRDAAAAGGTDRRANGADGPGRRSSNTQAGKYRLPKWLRGRAGLIQATPLSLVTQRGTRGRNCSKRRPDTSRPPDDARQRAVRSPPRRLPLPRGLRATVARLAQAFARARDTQRVAQLRSPERLTKGRLTTARFQLSGRQTLKVCSNL